MTVEGVMFRRASGYLLKACLDELFVSRVDVAKPASYLYRRQVWTLRQTEQGISATVVWTRRPRERVSRSVWTISGGMPGSKRTH